MCSVDKLISGRRIAKLIGGETMEKVDEWVVNLIKVILFHGIYLWIDINNIPSKIIMLIRNNNLEYIGFIAILMMVLFIILLRRKLISYWKECAWSICINLIIFSILGVISVYMLNNIGLYKVILFVMSVLVASIMLAWLSYKKEKDEKWEKFYDLKDIIESDFDIIGGEKIIIREKAVDYDLLNREMYINELLDIIYCDVEGSHVVGIKGPWGSGKSTIIKLMEARLTSDERFVVIDKFDPWLYGNEEAFLAGIIDAIEDKLGIKIGYLNRKRLLEQIGENISDVGVMTKLALDLWINIYRCLRWESDFKEKINNYLIKENKKVVFIIDNLDRADEANVILMFKLLGTVLDMPNIKYIVSFDDERMRNILKDSRQINPKYIEKIINQEIIITPIDPRRFIEIIKLSFFNMMRLYNLDVEGNYDVIFEYLVDRCDNLRQYKRYLNSVFPLLGSNKNELYIRDMIAIETIRFFDFAIYEYIRTNGAVFVNSSFRVDLFGESREDEDKLKLKSILGISRATKLLIEELFPNVYYKVNEIAYINSTETRDEIKRKSRICDDDVFDLYFSYSQNEYYLTKADVENVIIQINEEEINYNEMVDAFKEKLDVETHNLNSWFGILELYVVEVKNDAKYDMSCALVEALSTNETTNIIESSLPKAALNDSLLLLCGVDLEKIKEWCEKASINYNYTVLCEAYNQAEKKHDDLFWMDSFWENFRKYIVEFVKEQLVFLKDSKINLYDNSYYKRWNVLSLSNIVDEKYFDKLFFKDCINRQNVFNFLRDVVSYNYESSSVDRGTYNYFINTNYYKILVGDGDITDIVTKTDPVNKNEKILKEIYLKRNDGENVLRLTHPLDL